MVGLTGLCDYQHNTKMVRKLVIGTCRCQYVLLDDFKFKIHSVKCGVPHGSVLGLLLFYIFDESKILFTMLYAECR